MERNMERICRSAPSDKKATITAIIKERPMVSPASKVTTEFSRTINCNPAANCDNMIYNSIVSITILGISSNPDINPEKKAQTTNNNAAGTKGKRDAHLAAEMIPGFVV